MNQMLWDVAQRGTGLLTNLLRHCTPKNETTHEKQHLGDSFRFFKTRKSFPLLIHLWNRSDKKIANLWSLWTLVSRWQAIPFRLVWMRVQIKLWCNCKTSTIGPSDIEYAPLVMARKHSVLCELHRLNQDFVHSIPYSFCAGTKTG